MTPDSAGPEPERVAAFFRKHRTGLVTLVFTDLVDSVALMQQLGDQAGTTFLQQRRQIVRQTLKEFPEGEEIETAGDSFLLVFAKPSDAVRFAVLVQARFRVFSAESGLSVHERMGIHLGEVVISEHETEAKAKDLYGIQLATCARVMSLAQGGQILLTRGGFDSARQVLKGEDIPGVGTLSWVSHGPYVLKGIEEAVDVCEVGEIGQSPLAAPKTSEKAQRQVRPDEEPVLGWRPAVGQDVPGTPWVLEEKLGEGGFGEVWVGRHRKLKERRVFKFCFRAERVRALKREMTLFRLLKEHVGDHPNIVRLHEVYLENPPFYLEEEYVEGKDLKTWCEKQGSIDTVPLEVRLEIVAQAAEGLQAAHDAGIIHRDVKPGNILVSDKRRVTSDERESAPRASADSSLVTHDSSLSVKLTDFGIGQVISAEYLKGVTKAGFTQTMLGSTSSGTGTTMYLAPEIIAGQPATTRSDIYSLGVVLYQLLVGDFRHPLTADWTKEVPDELLREDLERCFAWKPEARFTGVAQLAKNLRAWEQRRAEVVRREAEEAERARLRQQAERRHQIVMISAGVAALFLLLALALGYGLSQAGRQRRRVEANLYAANINLAFRALEENNLGTALDLLERHRPKPGERDLRGWEWRYLWQHCQSDELRTLGSHAGYVVGLRFFLGGRLLASASRDQTVKVWELETGKVLASLPQRGVVSAIDISPDGGSLATGVRSDGDLRVRLWDTRTWREVRSWPVESGLRSVAFSPDGQQLATMSGDRVVLWNLATQEAIVSFPAAGGGLGAQEICFSPDGRMVAAPLEGDHVGLWDLEQRTNAASLAGHTQSITAIVFSPNGKYVATGSWDKTARVWDVKARAQVAMLTNHTAWVSSLAFSPTGDILATASADQRIRLWDTTNWLEVASLKGHLHEIWAVAFSPDGRTLASGGKDDTIRLWKSAAPPKPSTIRTLPKEVRGILPSPNGTHWGIVYRDGTLGLWDSAALTEYARVPALFPGLETVACALSPGASLIAQGGADRKVRLRDSKSGQQVAEFDLGDLIADGLWFSPEGTRMAVMAGSSRVIQLWDVTAKRQLVTLTDELPRFVGRPVFSPDGRELGTVHAGGVAAVWDLETGRPKALLPGHREETTAMAFSPDGQTIATCGDEGTLKLWDKTKPREPLVTLRGQLLTLHSVAFSIDGRRVAAGTGDGLIKIWDTETYQEVATLRGGSGGIGVLAFLPQGNTLVSATYWHEHAQEVGAWHAPSFAEIDAAEKTQASARPPAAK